MVTNVKSSLEKKALAIFREKRDEAHERHGRLHDQLFETKRQMEVAHAEWQNWCSVCSRLEKLLNG